MNKHELGKQLLTMEIKKTLLTPNYSEVRPHDDYASQFNGLNNSIETRTDEDKRKWANETGNLARHSFYFYCAETPLKLITHFVENSEFDNTWVANLAYSAERLLGMLGDVSRNLIYGHRDKNGNLDDNLGLEKFERQKHGINSNFSIGNINYYSQTGGKLSLVLLGLFNAEWANDIEWAVVNNLDSWWWRGMGTHLAFGGDFSTKVFNTLVKSPLQAVNDKDKITWGFVQNKFNEHVTNVKKSFSDYNTLNSSDKTQKAEKMIELSQNIDKTVSAFAPVFNFLSITGGILRPIARRFKLEGFSRNSIRILSVIDKPLLWLNNIFRFYIPEKIKALNDKNRDKEGLFNFLHAPDMLLTSTIGSIADFGSIVFESSIKESTGNIKHLVNISRELTSSLGQGYFSLRRMNAQKDLKNKSLYEKLQGPPNNN